MILNKIKINDTATVTPGVVYDISKATGQSYETLSDALSGNNVPPEVREGGMSVRFVQTSDNKYIQYRYIETDATTVVTFTNVANWQGVDDEPTAGSQNLVKSGSVYKDSRNIKTKIDNIYRNSDSVDLEYTIERNKTFANITIGTELTLADNSYRDVRKFIIQSLKGVIVANKINLQTENIVYAVITDVENTVVAVESMAAISSSYFIPINIAKYGDSSYYIYILTENSQTTFVCKFFSDSGIEALGDDMLVGINNREFNYTGNIPYLPANYSIGLILDSPVVGNPVALKYGIYRWCGIALLRKYIGCKIRVNYINAASGNGCVLVNEDGIIIASFDTTTNAPQNKEIDLTDYPNARYLYWEWSNNYPTSIEIIQREDGPETHGIEEDFYGYPSKTISFVNHDNVLWPAGITIGDTFTINNAVADNYRAMGEIDITSLCGDLNIKGILPTSRANIVITDASNKVILVRADSSYNAKTIETNVNLKDYPTATKIWFVAPLSNDYATFGAPEITNVYDGLETRVSVIENGMPQNGVLLLHFDSPLLSVNDRRLQLMKQYKFNVSWCISKNVFGDDDTFANWGSEDYKNAYWDVIKRGDDVGLYPAKIATEYDEAGWDSYFDTALANLAANGIHNITGFMCSRLDINDDLLNSVKKHNFKVIRGGGAKDSQSVDTYNYTKNNSYMPNVPTTDTFFVNASTMFGNDSNYTTYIQWLKSIIYYAIRTNTAISLFAHSVNSDGSSTINITEEHLVAVLDMIQDAVQNNGLKIMTWKQWYSCINRVDGHFWDENRLMKMCVAQLNLN